MLLTLSQKPINFTLQNGTIKVAKGGKVDLINPSKDQAFNKNLSDIAGMVCGEVAVMESGLNGFDLEVL